MRYIHDEELKLASRFLFLSMAIVVIEQDIEYVQTGHFKIKEPYLDLLQKMIFEAKNERRQLRKMMYDRELKVIQLRKNDLFTSFLFICRNQEEERNYFNPAIRNKVKKIIRDLLVRALPRDQSDSSDPDMTANT